MESSEPCGVVQSGLGNVVHSNVGSSRSEFSIIRSQIAVVIPALNEEATIGSIVLSAFRYSDQVYVINDGSTDKTSEVASLAGAEVIEMEHNGGKAVALMRGLRTAKREGYSYIVMMDGNAQHKSIDIPALIGPLENGSADMVIGSRFLNEDNQAPSYRQVGKKVLNTFSKIGSKGKLMDTHSGYRSLGPKALANLDLDSADPSVVSDMITQFANRGLNVIEVPISARHVVPNGHEQGSTPKEMRLLENVLPTVAYKKPLLLFGLPGLVLFIMGLGLGSLSFLDVNIFHAWLYQLVVSAGLMTVGAIMVMFGLMQNSLAMLLRMNSKASK
jgi:glycosyltransferase involved in cell wall biosynthesis